MFLAKTDNVIFSEIASVIASYTATGPEQLSLQPGQLIQVRKKSPSGWWEGELQVNFMLVNEYLTLCFILHLYDFLKKDKLFCFLRRSGSRGFKFIVRPVFVAAVLLYVLIKRKSSIPTDQR